MGSLFNKDHAMMYRSESCFNITVKSGQFSSKFPNTICVNSPENNLGKVSVKNNNWANYGLIIKTE